MGLWSLVQGCLMLVNAVCVLNNDRFLEPYGIGFSYLDSGASHVSLKSNIIHAIKWIQVIRSKLTKERNVLDSGYLYFNEQIVHEMKNSIQKGTKDPITGLILPDFGTWDIDQDEWEEGKAIVFGLEIAGIISQPTPCCLLEGSIEEELPMEDGHCFEIPELKPRDRGAAHASEHTDDKRDWRLRGQSSSVITPGNHGEERGHKNK